MGKNLRKILATVLTLCMVATLFAVPMTVNAEAPQDETYEEYDVINYLDLKDANGNALSATGTNLGGSTILTYNRTSPTGSAILKYRWTVGSGSAANYTGAEMNLSFEEVNGAAAYMFSALFSANQVNFRPYYDANNFKSLSNTLVTGSMHDIEFAKLKVKTGTNAGKYYVYLKIDGETIGEGYTNIGDIDGDGNYVTKPGDVTRSILSNKILFACHGTTGNKISQIPDYTYEDYDTVTYWDLTDESGNPLAETGTNMAGGVGLHYIPTSTTGSAILKYRWTVGNDINFQLSFGKVVTDVTGITYTFTAWLDRQESAIYPNGRMWLCPGNSLGSPCFEMPFALESGSNHDIEFARLKIANGANAGKYYVYIKIDGILIGETYVAENVVDSNGNYATGLGGTTSVTSGDIAYACWGISGVKISATPEEEIYDTVDELTLSDLGLNPGNFENVLPGTLSTYQATSASYSYVLKFNWRANLTPGTDEELCISPDGQSNHGRGLWMRGQNFLFGYPDGPKTILSAITSGDHLIEFGRKKVLSGRYIGKYYVYVKVDDVQLADGYIEYATPNNTICIRGSALDKQRFSDFAYPVEYEPYDEIYYSNLKYGGQPLGAETNLHGSPTFTYDRTSETGSAVLKYRWTVGTTETQLSIGKQANNLMSYVFGVWVRPANSTYLNGSAWIVGGMQGEVNLPFALQSGSSYDIEFGRLKIKSGHNAGKYYVYYKINGTLVTFTYIGANVVDQNGNYTDQGVTYSVLSGEIFMSGNSSKISETPYTEEYETYDEVDYEDLLLDGEPLSSNGTEMSGGNKILTYNPESPTGSAILKYRWTVGTAPQFQLSFGKVGTEVAYSFCAWMDPASDNFPNGKIWLCPGSYNREMNNAFAIAPNSSHNIEFARLKVKNGPKKGQYYVYLKVDDVLFNEVYAPANTVDANGNYQDYRAIDNNVLSGEFLFNFSGSNGSIISAYKENLNGEHLGIRGDFDENGIFTAADLTALVNLIIGVTDASTIPSGLGDFNNDKKTDILDLIAMKKYLAPVNTITKSGNLALGTQEHLLEDETKTAQYIADASKALGAKSYRLGMSIATLFWHKNSVNEVVVNEENMAKLKAQIKALKDNGITDILFVTDSFMIPWEYATDQEKVQNSHNLTVPNPKTEKEAYESWLKINANAFKKLAEECPEIRYFEPGNELNLAEAKLEKYGISWDSEANRSSYKYTVKEKAGIVADLTWNVSNAVKSVNPANQVTTPSISVQDSSAVQQDFAEELYSAINSGAYPSNQTLGDKRVDNYFSILNIHIYPHYNTTDSAISSDLNSYASQVNAFYNVAKKYNDGGSRVWITETGLSTSGSKTDDRNMETVANILTATLNKINTSLTFVDTVFIYKLADVSVDRGMSPQETDYGLFFSGDDLDCAAYGIKPSANAVASFFRGSDGAAWLNWLIGLYHE